jgi:hypothetical protein
MRAGTLSRFFPPVARRATRGCLQRFRLWEAVRRLKETPIGELPTRALLKELGAAWANEPYAANVDVLEEISRRAVATEGPILECGTGLTTIILGWLAGRRGKTTWSLEHSAEWYDRIDRALKRHRIPQVRVLRTPLREYDGFWWYQPPHEGLPHDFALVVCDGPPGDTPGGRYGLLPVMGDHLRNAVILLDDASRWGEREVLKRWETEYSLAAELREGPEGAFAVVERRR